MALTLEKEQRLRNAGLFDLFEKENPLWTAMAKEANSYTKLYVERAKAQVRMDDVVGPLSEALRVTRTLAEYLDQRKLKEKYWVEWF
ncbi:MAG: hypothetical protein ACRDHO_07855, partial [Actinomycetota bacterium]